MRHEFIKQGNICFILVLVSCVLNTLCRHWIFTSIGFCLGGLIWVFHPVKMNDVRPEKQQLLECRIAGIIVFVIGLMLRMRLYS